MSSFTEFHSQQQGGTKKSIESNYLSLLHLQKRLNPAGGQNDISSSDKKVRNENRKSDKEIL